MLAHLTIVIEVYSKYYKDEAIWKQQTSSLLLANINLLSFSSFLILITQLFTVASGIARCNNGAHSSLRAQVANLSRYSRIIRKIKYFFITSHGDLCRVSSCCSLRWGFLFIKCKFSSFSSLLFAHEWAFPTPLQLSFVFLYVSSRKRSRGLICKWKNES